MTTNIRVSKFKHIFGSPLKKEESFDDIPISKSAFDTSFADVNPKYIAVLLESSGGGSFLVIPIEKYGRQPPNSLSIANGHSKPVTDLKWCPHNENVIASASDDCTIKIWNVEDPEDSSDKLAKLSFTELATIHYHQRRVNLVLWHPSVSNVLLSAGADNLICLWNLETTEVIAEHCFDKPISSAAFNFDGSKIVAGLKDGHVAVLDAKTLTVLQEAKCHDSLKPTQVAYLKGDRILTAGFTKIGKRQYALWNANDLSCSLDSDDIDTNNGMIFIHYDADLNVLFFVGKGDSVVRYFEYDDQEPKIHYLNRFDTNDPQRGFAFMGKLGVNVAANEITRLYKLHMKRIEIIPFYVPRKSDQFQRDLYPDTPGPEPALTVEEWLKGNDSTPKLISLESNFLVKGSGTASVNRSVSTIGVKLRPPQQNFSTISVNLGAGNSTSTIKDLEKKVEILEKNLETVLQRLDYLENQIK